MCNWSLILIPIALAIAWAIVRCGDLFDQMFDVDFDPYDAQRYDDLHDDLLKMHRILQCIADCPPPGPTDSATLKALKGLCVMTNRLVEENKQLKAKGGSI